MFISNDIKYAGVNDRNVDLFEGQYKVENGMSYNSYVICDEKTAVFDGVDANFASEWLENIQNALHGEVPDYLIVLHMEPDHSGSILRFMQKYQSTKIVSNKKSFEMMKNFFGCAFSDRQIVVSDGEVFKIGKHEITFVFAPMVHWPEVMVAYDSYDKVLFSADAFGKFGDLNADEEWSDEARRYYVGIVQKYGMPVMNLLKKAETLDIKTICPLHGPVLNENLGYYINLYKKWASFEPEESGVTICYTSVYGNTKKAVDLLENRLKEGGEKVEVFDLARCDMSKAVASAFRFDRLVLATTTYCNTVFPPMGEFLSHLTVRDFKSRTVGFIENGAWAPNATKTMQKSLESCKNLKFLENNVRILSALDENSVAQVEKTADELLGESVAL